MTRRKIMLSMIMTVFLMLLVSESMSQTRRTYRPRTQPNRFQPPPGFKPPKFGSGGNSSSSSSSSRREVTDESKENSIKEAIGATDEQWKNIKPMLEKIKQLKEACMVINTGGGGGGGSQSYGGPQGRIIRTPRSAGGGASGGGFLRGTGGGSTTLRAADGSRFSMSWAWDKPWAEKGAQREDEKLCDRLFDLLRSNKAGDLQIKKAISSLNKVREETRKEKTYAQEKLRGTLTLEQEARLIVLGWLD